MPDLFIYLLIFIFGTVIGSFLNVCIWRIPRGESIARTPSHCAVCGARIKPYDLIPIISYIILGGKCRDCKTKIFNRYPLVELITGIGFVFLYYHFGASYYFVFYIALYSALCALSFIDFEHRIIPDGIVLFLLTAGILFNITRNIINFEPTVLISAVAGFFAASVPLCVMAAVTGGGMGGGDIKLMAVCGLFLGWKNIILAMFIGVFIACVVVAVEYILKIRGKEKTVVFGPFLSLGILIALVYGDLMINKYLEMVL